MTEQNAPDDSQNESAGKNGDPTIKNDADSTATSHSSQSAKNLTPEEQMALYEQDLKENDWGHQPC